MISTSPPTLTTRMMSTTIRPRFLSMKSCVSFMLAALRISRDRSRSCAVAARVSASCLHRHRRGNRRIDRLLPGNRLPNVVCHDEHPAEEQDSAEDAYRVIRVGCLHAFNEGVGQRAVGV